MKCGYLLFISARNLERRLLLSWQENIKWNSCSTSLNWQKGQIRRFSGILGIVCLPVSIDNWWFLSQYLFKGNLHYFNKYLLKCLKCTYYKIWKKNVSPSEIIFLLASKDRPYSPFKIPAAAILNGAQCTTGFWRIVVASYSQNAAMCSLWLQQPSEKQKRYEYKFQ